MSVRSRIWLSAICALALAGVVWPSPAAAGNSPKPDPSTKAAPAAARDRPPERGVVQSVSASGLVLRALDGSTVTVTVDARTRVLVDGEPASILDIRRGFVAVVTLRGASGQLALEVEAFTISGPALPLAGVVRSVSASGLVLNGPGGTRVTVAADTLARVLVDGKQASLVAVRAGFLAVVRPAAAGNELRELFAFSPPRQQGARLYNGVVRSVIGQTIVLQTQNAGTLRIALGAKTPVFVNGKPGSIGNVDAGDLVVFRTGPRREVWVFSVP